jgi:hypothetical protein
MKANVFKRIIAAAGITLAITFNVSAFVAGRQATPPAPRSQEIKRRWEAEGGWQSRLELAKTSGQIGRLAPRGTLGSWLPRELTA